VFFGLWGEFEWRVRRVHGRAEVEIGKKGSEDEKVGGEVTKTEEDANGFGDLITSSSFRHFKIGRSSYLFPSLLHSMLTLCSSLVARCGAHLHSICLSCHRAQCWL